MANIQIVRINRWTIFCCYGVELSYGTRKYKIRQKIDMLYHDEPAPHAYEKAKTQQQYAEHVRTEVRWAQKNYTLPPNVDCAWDVFFAQAVSGVFQVLHKHPDSVLPSLRNLRLKLEVWIRPVTLRVMSIRLQAFNLIMMNHHLPHGLDECSRTGLFNQF